MYEQSVSVNGIDIYSMTNPALKSFCLSLYIRAGSLFENTTNNGISHLFEHIVFRNLKNKYENFYELLALHGLDLQGCTYKEFIRFSINGPHDEFDFATDILCSLFDEIKLTSSDFLKEKKRIKAEIREKDERNSLDYFFDNIVWNGSEAEKTVLGYCKNIDGFSIKKINAFRENVLSKNNLFVYVTGNVSQEDKNILYRKIEKININNQSVSFTNTVTVNKDFFNRKGIVNIKNDYWHYVKIGFDIDCSKYSGGVYDLIYAVLFKGDAGLVHNYLSEDNPIIYSFESTLEQYDNIGNINFKFEVGKEKIVDAVRIIVSLLNHVKNGQFNFDANLKYEMSNSLMELDKPDDLNWSMAYYNHIIKTDSIDYSDEFYGRFNNITKEQIIQAAKEIFRTRNMTIAIKGNKRKIRTTDIEMELKTLDKEF